MSPIGRSPDHWVVYDQDLHREQIEASSKEQQQQACSERASANERWRTRLPFISSGHALVMELPINNTRAFGMLGLYADFDEVVLCNDPEG